MDFPVFHLDIMGDRLLIAIIAILHVLINHGLAVGLMPTIAAMEWWGHKKQDPAWDRLAYKILFVAFIITTTVGALTGVGIWLSASLINPYGIASLIRVFFWGWFIEWLVFITEVVLILAYFLTWKKWTSPEQKRRHIWLGFALGLFSWITMAIIVSILGFMMDPGNWLTHNSLWNGFTNPIYLPQLAFRTPLALAQAGIISMFLTILFTKKDEPIRRHALRALGLWTLAFTPFVIAGALWYFQAVPAFMKGYLGVALFGMQFEQWLDKFHYILIATVVFIVVIVQFALFRPNRIPAISLLIPLLAIIYLTGHFERVREFIRKPYIIGKYMYANGIRAGDYPLLNQEGILAHATYTHPLSPKEKVLSKHEAHHEDGTAKSAAEIQGLTVVLQDGKDVFVNACSRCHTGHGVNSLSGHFSRSLGDQPWRTEAVAPMVANMHQSRPFMPPFPGNDYELQALTVYIQHLQTNKAPILTANDIGVEMNPRLAKRLVTKATSSQTGETK